MLKQRRALRANGLLAPVAVLGSGEAKRGRVVSRSVEWILAGRQSACFLRRVLVKCWWGFSLQLLASPKAPFSFCQLAFVACSLRRWVWPNPACSGHGYAVGQRWRFVSKETSLTMLLGKHAVPLTQSLGKGQGWGRKRAEGEKRKRKRRGQVILGWRKRLAEPSQAS